jgi:hypothetical protein
VATKQDVAWIFHRAKALAKFPGSGAAQEAARKKMGLKSRQNRVNSFFLDLWAAGSVVNAGSGNRMARFRQTILLRFSKENF